MGNLEISIWTFPDATVFVISNVGALFDTSYNVDIAAKNLYILGYAIYALTNWLEGIASDTLN